MKVNAKALGLTLAILWGAGFLFIATANSIWPSYGETFLHVIESCYFGYHVGSGFGSILLGTFWAVVDAGVGGFLIGWIYNRLSG